MSKRIALTGTASALGVAIVRELYAKDLSVVGLSESISPHLGWHHVDLTDAAAVANLRTGVLDGLINAAERLPEDGGAVEILEFNWFCTRLLTDTLLPQLAPGAAIATLASRAGREWRKNLSQVRRLMALPHSDRLPDFVRNEKIDPDRAYALSKEAHIVWTKQNAGVLRARDLRANTISPAADGGPEPADGKNRQKAHLGSVAAVAGFLVDRGSSWIHGQDLIVDGGCSAAQEAQALGLNSQTY
ncbi:hypothetical protein [Tranquillimonas alkanivorans]|uniref:NAD(P)-dependent dehydrogenase, short-chain alcohol dehydrogenase family n=1 Tax=Tranquillimonas alkanivorans TaxID=441119 RepID=A0A1I5UJ44_9RHOB|nr:hypothetical protein [Tranquillimonas alkanivorans]SFP95314.1 NAD(P)-dependent dehydrogenase, short-chain alcohol dehydrogenase family [Tranquillimonas alkanivorans]